MHIVEEIVGYLASHKTWLVLVHEKPDGDTLGSAAALVALGVRLGKTVLWGGRDEVPFHYEFLITNPPYEIFPTIPLERLGDDAVVVCVDTSTIERSVSGLEDVLEKYLVINIDHHTDNARFGTINWVDPEASATGEMLTELMSSSLWGITALEARALYVAIVSDNGGFRFASTSIRSHECAIELLRAGASPSEIARALDSNLTVEALHLWGAALTRTETFAGGKAALFCLTNEDFEATGCLQSATENLVNFLLHIKGVLLVALVSEAGEYTRVSLRAHAPMNARTVATRLGGGGHDLAAGCKVEGAAKALLPELRSVMEEHIEGRLSGAR